MGGSRIFDWGGPRIEKARDDRQNVALFALKSWPIGGGHGPVAPPPWNRPCVGGGGGHLPTFFKTQNQLEF